MTPIAPVEEALAAVAAGGAVVVVDDEDRENEGDLIFAADAVTPDLVAFMMTQCRGLICVPMPGEVLDRLRLGPMVAHNTDRLATAFTVSVDARSGISTGISAADRAATIARLADAAGPTPTTRAEDLTRPGHVFPLRARPGGVLSRAGHTEAAVDLARLAGRHPAGVICEIAEPDGRMARLPALGRFAATHRLPLVTIADLIAYRRRHDPPVRRVADTRMPLAAGEFRAIGYSSPGGAEHVALTYGDLGDGTGVLVRIHSECLTGDAFGSLRCDCGGQFAAALDRVAAQGRGVVLYLRGQEGRGIGLLPKLQAYQRQDAGHDTVEANLALGWPVDARSYDEAAHVLQDLGVRSVRLLTNNPAKQAALADHGIAVLERVPLPVQPTSENLGYLRAKRDRMGHLLDLEDERTVPYGSRLNSVVAAGRR